MDTKYASNTSKFAKIGESFPRVEDRRLLEGKGRFIDDIEPGPSTLHAVFVRSPYAHAKVVSISTEQALQVAGVVEVLTAADFDALIKPIRADFPHPDFCLVDRIAMPGDRVRFVGDTIALVLAENPYAALDGAEAVEGDFEDLPAVATADSAVTEDAPVLHAGAPGNVAFESAFSTPGFDAVHDAAPHRLQASFSTARQTSVSIEPRGCIASFDAPTGLLTVWSSTQVPHLVQQAIAEHLAMQETDIRVIVPDVGGGFGMKTVIYPEELLVAAAAIKYQRPVKWIQDRYDDFLSSAQAREHEYTMDVGFDDRGVVLSLKADVLVNIGAYPSLPFGSSLEANGAPRNMPGPYTLRNFSYRTRAVMTNTSPTGAYRGVAAPAACMAVEGMMDRIARHLHVDPLEIRRRNIVATFPYTNVLGLTYEEGCLSEMLERAVVLAGYARLRDKQASINGESDWKLGIGISVTTEQTGMGAARYKARGLLRIPGFESAVIRILPDGSVNAGVSQASQGQGHITTFTQIVSDRLHVPMHRIRLEEGDTAKTPAGSGTFASRGVVIAGNAVMRACDELIAKLKLIAASEFQCSAEDLLYDEGAVFLQGDPEKHLTLHSLARIAYSRGLARSPAGLSYGLEATVYQDPPGMVLAATVHIATCHVHTVTGQVELQDYTIIHDCGRMVNPELVDGQIQGATVQGIGEVLMEAIHYDEHAQPMTISLMEYEIPRAKDVVPFRIEALHSERGARIFKGVGESGTIGAVPAVVNAIADALSALAVEVDRIPLNSQTVQRLIAEAATSSSSSSAYN